MNDYIFDLSVIVFVAVILIVTCSVEAAVKHTPKANQIDAVSQVYKQILKNTKLDPPYDPMVLAKLIVSASKRFNIDPLLYSAIIMTESGYKINAYNSKTKDYGIAQINERNIAYYGFSKHKLMTNYRYSIRAGAIILSWFSHRYKQIEAKRWYCRYNVGVKSTKRGSLKYICNRYIRNVRRYLK